eukprot:Em0023g759a
MMKVKDRCKPPPKEKQLYSLKAAASKHSSGTEQDWWNNALRFLGLIAGLYLAYLYTCQLQLLHENQLWFSHLTVSVTECFTSRQRDLCAGAAYYHWIRIAQELERDLSFRSESALYYSYYKQLVTAPSLYKVLAILAYSVVYPGYHNPLSSMFICFTIAWALVTFMHSSHYEGQVMPTYLYVLWWALTIGLSISLNMIFKLLFFGYEDSVLMFKYVCSKLGLALFNAFQPMSKDTVLRTLGSGLLPCYVIAIAVFFKPIMAQIRNALQTRLLYLQDFYTHRHQEPQSKAQSSTLARRPDPAWAYAVLLSLLLGMLSLWTTRFQYLWVPCACSIAAAGVCHSKLWRDVSGAIGAKSSVSNMVRLMSIGTIILAVTLKEAPALLSQLRLMKQLHMPDTVALMQWIDSHTPHSAVFAGSCQILAATRLCTGRATTVGPYIEDNWLLKSAWQTYQIYAREDPGVVYDIMGRLGAEYMIVEAGLCSSLSTECSLVGAMDLAANVTSNKLGHAPILLPHAPIFLPHSPVLPHPPAPCPPPSSCPMPPSSYPMSPSSYPMSPSSCPMSPSSYPMSPSSYPMSPSSCPMSPSSCPMPPSSCPMPPSSCPMSPSSCPMPPSSYPMPPSSCPMPPSSCPMSPFSCPMSPSSYPMSPSSCPMPPSSYPMPPSSCPMSPSSYPMPPSSCPMPPSSYPMPPFSCPMSPSSCPMPLVPPQPRIQAC